MVKEPLKNTPLHASKPEISKNSHLVLGLRQVLSKNSSNFPFFGVFSSALGLY
jgi:hypothetical protein